MSYPWQRVPAEQAIETARRQSIHFDSWVLVTFDDANRSSAEQPKSAAWFSGPEEATLYLETCLVPLWVGPSETALRDDLLGQIAKLAKARKFKLRDLEAWRKAFNALASSKGQILWLGAFDDLSRGELSAGELCADLDFWLGENGVELAEFDPDEPRQQRLVVDFLIQIGA